MGLRLSRRGFLAMPAMAYAGVVDWGLEAAESWTRVGGRMGLLYTFNGAAPGPVMEARPGDTVRIDFRNNLREMTNLHFHGLHIPPAGAADNAFRMVESGEAAAYEFTLPENHAAGTYWVHPHMHETAARQVSRGLAMAFVVRGELDAIPEIQAATEYVLVLQDFALNAAGAPVEPSMMERMAGREGSLVTVNGASNPVVQVQQDGWVRLRLINASASRFYRLRMEEHAMYQIATDGGGLPAPRGVDELLLAPGERAEVMIQGERPAGAYRMWNLPYDRGGMARAGAAMTLLTLEYSGRAEQVVALPSRLVAVERLEAPVRVRRFELGQQGMGFTINGRRFDAGRVDTVVALDTVEDWEFHNTMTMDHPMHVHTNPFQVVGADGVAAAEWKDVVLVRARSLVRVRMAFRDFAGMAMYHCHILDHEDLGMMGVVRFG